MLDKQKFFTDFENLVKRLEYRGITKEQLLFIKEKITKQKELTRIINELRQARNQLSQAGSKNAEKVREIKKEITSQETELIVITKEIENLTSRLPNLPVPGTPTNEEGNRIIDSTQYQHNIQHNLTHEQILKKLAIIDEEKSILLSGSKFAVYQGFGSELLHALINFMRSENRQRGYQLFDTPYLVNAHNLYNTGQFHKFQDNLYKLEESNFYLLPTAEVSLVNLYQNQILTEENLPLNLCAYSPCFRAERMAAGQENKGLIRLHQFHKVELVKIVKPENSYQELEKLLADARHILHLLKIPHRVIELCQEELGFTAAKTYDIEVWLPIMKKESKNYYPHTLNGSALAVDRLIITLCEYYYDEKENCLIIPEVLKKKEFERVVERARKNEKRTNFLLSPNATAAEKAKYNLCKSIARYERENKLSEQELAKKLGISHPQLTAKMSEKKYLPKPTNLRTYPCDLTINKQRFIKLEISPYYEKHNREYLEALAKKGIVLSKEELVTKLITDDLLRKILLPQLDGEEEIRADGFYYHYTYYFAILHKRNKKAYKLIWCVADNEPHVLDNIPKIEEIQNLEEYGKKLMEEIIDIKELGNREITEKGDYTNNETEN
ncbi:9159_t:CDS:2 [Entrophospora sp. SA101]|nr:9159_t:CDS:2 [Entrophospora sp. SA101]